MNNNYKMNLNEWQISVLCEIHGLFPFHLILIWGLVLLPLEVEGCFSWWLSGVCSFRVFAKNIGDPYYEPTIVVHDCTPTVDAGCVGNVQ